MAIDYEQIRTTIGAVWCKGLYSTVSSRPTQQMLVPNKGPLPLKMVVEYYKEYCKKHNIEPQALSKAPVPKINTYRDLFGD